MIAAFVATFPALSSAAVNEVYPDESAVVVTASMNIHICIRVIEIFFV
jgi:hypothetical protein